MLKFFQSKSLFMPVLYFIITGVFAFFIPKEIIQNIDIQNQAVLYKQLLLSLGENQFAVLYKLLTAVFLGLTSLAYNRMVVKLRICKTYNFFQGFILLLLIGLITLLIDALHVIIVGLIFLAVFNTILNTLRKGNAVFDFFNAGLLLSTTLLFWVQFLYFFPIIFIGLFILRGQNWREWVVSLIGLILPIFLFLSFSFILFSNIDIVYDYHKLLLTKGNSSAFPTIYIVGAIYLLFLILLASFKILSRFNLIETVIQDYYKNFFMLFLLSLSAMLLSTGDIMLIMIFTIMSVVIPLSSFFLNIRRKYLAEILFDLFLVFVITVIAGIQI